MPDKKKTDRNPLPGQPASNNGGVMENQIHRLCDLFRQLGLPDDPASVERFLAAHRPLPNGVPLAEAPWWSPSQAQFLREELCKDGDWAEVVDLLGSLLS